MTSHSASRPDGDINISKNVTKLTGQGTDKMLPGY